MTVPLPPGIADAPQGTWRSRQDHRAWLDAEFLRLLRFSPDPRHPAGGFAWLDGAGRGDIRQPVHTWITARMTHVHAVAAIRGVPGSAPLADHGIAALNGPLRDQEHGGWHQAIDGTPIGRKDAYTHAFVILAASSATVAGRVGAADLLDSALATMDTRFWDPDAGRMRESFGRDFSDEETYRGANSNMHSVEALLAAGDVLGAPIWHDRALTIATHLIDEVARSHAWRLVEHFDEGWAPLLEYHADDVAHPFRPYGTTIGHWLEWARLLLHLEASLASPPGWLLEAATELFAAAVGVGWAADGRAGFPYTLDWQDRPVVHARLHWVVAEAIGAAAAMHERTGDPVYEAWYRTFWDHAAQHLIDREDGSWHHELTADLAVASGTWGGKPDLYHAMQATLLPQLALAPSMATQLAEIDDPQRREPRR